MVSLEVEQKILEKPAPNTAAAQLEVAFLGLEELLEQLLAEREEYLQHSQSGAEDTRELFQEVERLRAENAKLKAQLEKAESGYNRLKKASGDASRRLGASIHQLKLVLEA